MANQLDGVRAAIRNAPEPLPIWALHYADKTRSTDADFGNNGLAEYYGRISLGSGS